MFGSIVAICLSTGKKKTPQTEQKNQDKLNLTYEKQTADSNRKARACGRVYKRQETTTTRQANEARNEATSGTRHPQATTKRQDPKHGGTREHTKGNDAEPTATKQKHDEAATRNDTRATTTRNEKQPDRAKARRTQPTKPRREHQSRKHATPRNDEQQEEQPRETPPRKKPTRARQASQPARQPARQPAMQQGKKKARFSRCAAGAGCQCPVARRGRVAAGLTVRTRRAIYSLGQPGSLQSTWFVFPAKFTNSNVVEASSYFSSPKTVNVTVQLFCPEVSGLWVFKAAVARPFSILTYPTPEK